ncbi:MAG: S9 family peptidase [Candidatus Marinimicrobia bacterium]|nr:S9 family peptidase [Candidatus Neomarinimicrobiota bacterium]
MIRLIIYLIFAMQSVHAVWLTYEEAMHNSPFKSASMGWTIPFPNEDAILIRGSGDNWRKWYKVDLLSSDTILFLDSMALNNKGDDIYVSDLEFSKKGDKVLIRTDSKKIWRYSHFSTYFVYDVLKKRLNPLTDQNKDLRNVKFSPNGELIAYIRKDNNLYVYDIPRGRQRQLTTTGSETISNGHFGWLYEEELTGYDGYRWSPNSESIAYWEEDESMVPEFSMINDLGQYPSTRKIRYPKAGERNPTLRIGVIRIKGAGRKWIDNALVDDDYLPWMEWVNDQKLSFIKMRRNQKNWDLFVSDRTTGRSLKVLSEDDEAGWLENHGQIRYLSDGKIIWISERSGYKHIWMSKHSGSRYWPITEGSWEVSNIVHIDEESKLIYFMANKESIFEKRLYSIRFDGTELALLTPESGSHSVRVTGTERYFIDTYSSLDVPRRILLKELKTGNIIRVLGETALDQFNEYEWSNPKIVHFPSADGSTILDGTLILPPDHDPDKKYPVIIHGYGMPGTQIVWNRWGSIWDQYLAQQGYVVFSMDSRGMSGRGETFKNLSYGDMSKYLALDNVAGINFLIDEGYADPKRIGAWGWSGGGYFTCLMLTRNAKYFKAGVAIAPCTDFRLYDTAYTERSMGMPQTNKAGYDSTSVLSWVHRMEGSILLMHGTEDDNVHAQHTTQFVQSALRSGKDVEWYQYPGRNHGIYGGGARDHLYKKMMEYFKENL